MNHLPRDHFVAHGVGQRQLGDVVAVPRQLLLDVLPAAVVDKRRQLERTFGGKINQLLPLVAYSGDDFDCGDGGRSGGVDGCYSVGRNSGYHSCSNQYLNRRTSRAIASAMVKAWK